MQQFTLHPKSSIFAVDVSSYANQRYDPWQMEQIRKGHESGVDVSVYADPKYSYWQMEQLRLGLESGIDVSVYADPKYDAMQMDEIRQGLEQGVDVSIYADPRYNYLQMHQIFEGLEQGVDVSEYANPEIDNKKMLCNKLYLLSCKTLNLNELIKMNHFQLDEIESGLESGVNVSAYADPSLSHVEMKKLRKDLIRRKALGRQGGIKQAKEY